MSSCTDRFPCRAALAAAVCLVLEVASPANAASSSSPLVVQNCNESGAGSLREAYASAVDTNITLEQLACSTITLTSGPLVSHADAGSVRIYGPRDRTFTISGNHASRIFAHHGNSLEILHLTIQDGVANDALGGGCIYGSQNVGVTQSTVTGCSVSTVGTTRALGGGVRAMNGVEMFEARITDNSARAAAADAEGGGVYGAYLLVRDQSTISGNRVISDSSHFARGGGAFVEYLRAGYTTISGNQAQHGGGLYIAYTNHFSPSSLQDTTISGNQASGAAGGLFIANAVRISNSTIASNLADFDAGLYLLHANAELRSTIVANNASDDGLTPSDIGGSAGSTLTGTHDLIIASALTLPANTLMIDPKLGPLADNGGGLLTHALLRGSPAIDAGENSANLGTDARGYLCNIVDCYPYDRTFGPATDIGAFEFGSPDKIFNWDFELHLD